MILRVTTASSESSCLFRTKWANPTPTGSNAYWFYCVIVNRWRVGYQVLTIHTSGTRDNSYYCNSKVPRGTSRFSPRNPLIALVAFTGICVLSSERHVTNVIYCIPLQVNHHNVGGRVNRRSRSANEAVGRLAGGGARRGAARGGRVARGPPCLPAHAPLRASATLPQLILTATSFLRAGAR